MVVRDNKCIRYINNNLLQPRYKRKSNCIQSVICLESHFYFDSHNEEIVTTKVKTLKPSILVNVVCAIYDLIYLHFARTSHLCIDRITDLSAGVMISSTCYDP